MLSSRGVCLACRVTGRSVITNARSPSFASRNFSVLSKRPQAKNALRTGQLLPHHATTNTIPRFAAFAQARFNSSSTGDPLSSEPVLHTPELFHKLGLDSPEKLSSATDVPDAWFFGYLTEQLGGFGWGPTSTVQWLFEHIHVYAGTTMGLSIVLTAAVVRLATFYFVVRASDASTKMRRLQPIFGPIQAKMREAMAAKDQLEMGKCQRQMAKIRKENDINLLWTLAPMIQLPIGFGSWRLIRNMAYLPIPGMSAAGFWWFNNLCIPDPYFILPMATGFLQHMSIRLGGETGTGITQAKMRAFLMWVLPFLTPLFIGFAPAGIQLSFFTASCFSLATNFVMKSNTIRSLLKITPIYKPPVIKPQVKFVDTTGEIVNPRQSQQSLTPISKVKTFVGGLHPRTLLTKAQKAQEEIADSLTGEGSPLAPIFKTKTPAEKRKEKMKSTLSDREIKRAREVVKEEERAFKAVSHQSRKLRREQRLSERRGH